MRRSRDGTGAWGSEGNCGGRQGESRGSGGCLLRQITRRGCQGKNAIDRELMLQSRLCESSDLGAPLLEGRQKALSLDVDHRGEKEEVGVGPDAGRKKCMMRFGFGGLPSLINVEQFTQGNEDSLRKCKAGGAVEMIPQFAQTTVAELVGQQEEVTR